jgi:hypothetical protein
MPDSKDGDLLSAFFDSCKLGKLVSQNYLSELMLQDTHKKNHIFTEVQKLKNEFFVQKIFLS